MLYFLWMASSQKALGTRSVLNKYSLMCKYPRSLWCTESILRSCSVQRIEMEPRGGMTDSSLGSPTSWLCHQGQH